MKTVSIDLGERSYDIRIGHGLLEQAGEILPWIKSSQVLVLSNEIVAPLYLDAIRTVLADKRITEVVIPDGEQVKNLDTVSGIFDSMLAVPLDRSTTVIALGGGVIGDIAGFVAACYQRGIPFIQVPTTLLSQVDSSVGGKTGVNHPLGKNMIGAFYQPVRVLADLSTLSTLDDRQFSAGLAEVIKYGLIDEPDFFEWLESSIDSLRALDPAALETAVERSCRAKARVVEMDEREGGVRALLNLGHTFGHAIETATGYSTWLHGEAVGLGMVMAADLSRRHGWLSDGEFSRIESLIGRAGLPTRPTHGIEADQLKSLMGVDKKVEDGRMRLILLKGIGRSFISDDFSDSALDQTLGHFCLGRDAQ